MKMPTRKILDASHVVAINAAYSNTRDRIISHVGIPNGMRAIITIGDVRGMMDAQKAIGALGSLNTDIIMMSESMIGSIITVLNCWPSMTESTAEPEAA